MKRTDRSLELERRRSVLRRVFATPDGQEALKILTAAFDGSCYARGDPHHTAYLEGGRDVLIFIRQATEDKEAIDG